MNVEEAFHFFRHYDLWLIVVGIALLATTILPRLLSRYPFSMPMILLILGFTVIVLPLGLKSPDTNKHSSLIEHIAELGVIISLMGAGLKIDRKIGLKSWESTWRLLGITMIITIILTALIGWWMLALTPAAAVLLAAVIAPTDPVLASEVQVGAPGAGSSNTEIEVDPGGRDEDEVRFSLTSEAGLNDGLAFPFVNMAIAMVIAGFHPQNWLRTWLLVDIFYKIGVAVVVGALMGYILAKFILSLNAQTKVAEALIGIGALAATLLIYGVTQALSGYGFLATFIGAIVIRNMERDHKYYHSMHILIEKTERIFVAVIIVALGAAIGGGLLTALDWPVVLCALIIIFIIRPLGGMIGFLGFKKAKWSERFAISFLGVRGIGSIYYLAFALNVVPFEEAEKLWTVTALIIIISIFVHGLTATPITKKLDKDR